MYQLFSTVSGSHISSCILINVYHNVTISKTSNINRLKYVETLLAIKLKYYLCLAKTSISYLGHFLCRKKHC